jgi:hypothetical protein
MENNILAPGMKVDVYQDGQKIDEGVILKTGTCSNQEGSTLKFKSELLRIEGILEFGNFNNEHRADAKWFYIFPDPFEPLKKCISPSSLGYEFRPKNA